MNLDSKISILGVNENASVSIEGRPRSFHLNRVFFSHGRRLER